MASRPTDDDLVRLSVGGKKFVTTEWTLSARGGHNLLTQLVANYASGRLSSAQDDGYLFIDRNPKLFAVVLEYLRTGVYHVPPGVSDEMLRIEFDFYQISIDDPPTRTPIARALDRVAFIAKEWVDENKEQIQSLILKAISDFGSHATIVSQYHPTDLKVPYKLSCRLFWSSVSRYLNQVFPNCTFEYASENHTVVATICAL